MSKAKEKMQLCADGLMDLYDKAENDELAGTLLGLHQLAAEAIKSLSDMPAWAVQEI